MPISLTKISLPINIVIAIESCIDFLKLSLFLRIDRNNLYLAINNLEND